MTESQTCAKAAPSSTYTAIWQAEDLHEREFLKEILAPFIDRHLVDGRRDLVLDHSIVIDSHCGARDPAYYLRFCGKDAFLVHLGDENYEGGYQIYENFRGVIRSYWSGVFYPQRVLQIPLGYGAGLDRGAQPLVTASQRRYLWSFLGQAGKSSRPDMARELIRVVPNFFYATDHLPGFSIYNRLNGKPRRFAKPGYTQFMLDSSFSPCPMGNVKLDSYRVYEALECGSIPIVEKRLTLDYFRQLLGQHPIPTVRSWAEARSLMIALMDNPNQMDELQRRCMEWWQEYKTACTARIGEFLASRSANPEAYLGPIVAPIHSRPGWQAVELLRHHDWRAMLRRVHRQTARLLRTGATREAIRPGSPPA
jgi:hypothetical protein